MHAPSSSSATRPVCPAASRGRSSRRPAGRFLLAGALFCALASGARAGEDDRVYHAAVRTTDHAGRFGYTILESARSSSPPAVAEIRSRLNEEFREAAQRFNDALREFVRDPANAGREFEGSRPERPSVQVLGVFEARAEAEAAIDRQKEQDKLIADPGRDVRRRIMRERILDHFNLGVQAPVAWMNETRDKHGAKWDFSVAYLPGGSNKPNTKDRRGWFAGGMQGYINSGYVPWVTWYNLSQSLPANYEPNPPTATQRNMRIPATMRAYFEDFKGFMQICAKYKPHPICVQIEPDEWGHMLLSTIKDRMMYPEKVDVKVGSTGMPELKDLPDNLIGYAKALKRLRDMYAPYNVMLGVNPSGWDWRGSMTPQKWVQYLEPCGVFEWEFAVFETGDRDKGAQGKQPPYGEDSGICGTFDNHLNWIAEFHKATGLYVFVWQVAVGNTYFRTCNNTPKHHCDNLYQRLLEGYPENPWIGKYVAAGCAGFLHHGGQGFSTHVFDDAGDGITNPEPIAGNQGHVSEYSDDDGGFMRIFGGKYYENPYPILGKRKAVAARAKAKKRPPAKKIESAKRRKPRPDALAEWDAKLIARAREDIAGGRGLRFSVSAFQQRFEVLSVDEAGAMKLKSPATEVDMAWPRFEIADRLALARALLREGTAGDHCLVAFYTIASGDEEGAREHLDRGAGGAEGVEASFEKVSGKAASPETSETPETRDTPEPRESRKKSKPLAGRTRPAEEKPQPPASDPAAARLYQEAETAFIDGDTEGAKRLFEKIVEEHPKSTFAPKAREYLDMLE